jgi:very-long-chain (3R)-3-hydroxyacyl-CoA dehydratase
MVGSWALVEVPRYLYLAVNTICKSKRVQPPLLLHLLRYNLFMLLYPSGISGEYLQVSPRPRPRTS